MNPFSSFLCESAVTQLESGTGRLISFLEHQLSLGIWTDPRDFEQVHQYLIGEIATLPDGQPSRTESELYKRTIDHLIRRGLDQNAVGIWFQGRIQDLRRQSLQRSDVLHESRPTFRKAIFVRVAGGPIQFSYLDRFGNDLWNNSTLPYDFEVMDIPVTQAMWDDVMGSLPDRALEHVSEEDILSFTYNGREIRLAPDFPVKGVSLHQAIAFANEMSRRHGLPLAYTELTMTEEKDGALLVTPATWVDHDMSKLEGFRLLTHAEWRRMLHDHHAQVEALPTFAARKTLLLNLGVFSENSRGLLQKVGTKIPFLYDGCSVFDLLGLVYELVHEVDLHQPQLVLGSDQAIEHQTRMRGGCFRTSPQMMSRAQNAALTRADLNDYPIPPDPEDLGDVGFRLVRTIREQGER